ncbi:MAG TPA: hypothetical protein VIT23_01150 [Terrimicrobiaceae bacterium]
MNYDPDKLEFPKDIAGVIGLSSREINFLKLKGCKFFGRKTTIRWVRTFLEEQAGPVPEATALATEHSGHPAH